MNEIGTKALAVEKIGPRRPMTRKRLIGAPGTNFFSLGQKTVFVKGGDYTYQDFSAYRPYSTQK